MANNRYVYQQQNNVSINKTKLVDLATYDYMSKTDFRVCLVLFSELNGWDPSEKKSKDPKNYKRIDVSSIASTLDLKKKKVEESIDRLVDFGILQKGSSDLIAKGYRFTF